eukprot:2808754-Amphidinium_carterae.1
MYRSVLDRDQLKALAGAGVKYFLDTLRPYFIKNKQSVFLYRFFQVLKLHRGGQDINRWITRVEVILEKARNAWMDLLIVLVPDEDARMRAVANVNLNRPPDQQIPIQPDAAAIALARTKLENEIKARHRNAFPIGNNLQALMMIVMADLKEQQRELLMATLYQRNIVLDMLIPQQLTEVMRALLCQPKSSIENPSWGQQMSGQRSFLVIQQGECFGTSGYWVEDDETGEEGFLEEFQDTFWVHDEEQAFWMQ